MAHGEMLPAVTKKNMGEAKDQQVPHVEGFVHNLLDEVIKAEMSMHQAQIQAWKWFAKTRPYGDLINENIHEGFAGSRYLSVTDLKLDFRVKPWPVKRLWDRLRLAFRLLRGSATLGLYRPMVYEVCRGDEPEGIDIHLHICRDHKGNYQVNQQQEKPMDHARKI